MRACGGERGREDFAPTSVTGKACFAATAASDAVRNNNIRSKYSSRARLYIPVKLDPRSYFGTIYLHTGFFPRL